MTALLTAAGLGHASVVTLLLDAKANINQANEVR
jgi:ankyrin repeat protein